MPSADPRKDLPSPSTPGWKDRANELMRTYLGQAGNPLDRGLTLRDLTLAGIIGVNAAYLAGKMKDPAPTPGPAIGTPYVVDLTPPPTPTGIVVAAGITYLYLECDDQVYTMGHGHDETVVYGAQYTTGALPTFAAAVEITRFKGRFFAYATNPNTQWHIWMKWKTRDGVLSAAPGGGTNGQMAKTGVDVRSLLDAITAAAEDPLIPLVKFSVRADLFYVAQTSVSGSVPIFSVVTTPFTQGGVLVPVGVYFRDGYIQNGTITNLKVANAAIDDAKIANLSASKILAGSIQVGQYIQSTGYVAGSSGWFINGNGTAEFSTVTVRGTVYASAGAIGGNVLSATQLYSTNWVSGSTGYLMDSTNGRIFAHGGINGGAFTGGYTWPATGTGFHLSKDGLLIGNFNTGKYFQVNGDGDILAPHFTIVSGVATFSGTLSAAGGTFTGALSAATGTFAGTLTAANAVIAGNITAGTITANEITGGGISQSYVASNTVGGSTCSTGAVVSVPLGTQAIIVTFDPGYSYSSGAGKDAPGTNEENAGSWTNGTITSHSKNYVILAPSAGTYTFSASRSSGSPSSQTNMILTVTVLKR